MPNNWTKYKLKDLTTKIGSGSTPRGGDSAYINEGISLIRSQNILDFTFSYNGLAHINEQQAKELNGVTIYKDDVLINITGDSVARVSQVPDDVLPARVNQHVAILRANHEALNSIFLKYYLLQPRTKADLLSISSSGATRKAITKVMLEEFPITIPPLPEQKAIAEILSSLDDKIELNLQTNKTLEEMANALYKHWFVDFGPFKDGNFKESELGLIPEGWELKAFSDLYDLRKGLSYKSKDYDDDGIPMINLKCVDRNGGFRYDGIKYYKGEYKNQHIVEAGDLLVAMTDLTQDRSVLGSPLFAPNIKTKSHIIASLDISILKQIDSNLPNLNLYFYYLMRTKKYHEYILGFGNGSTVVHLDKLGIVNYKALLPSSQVIKEFNSHASVIRNSIELNIDENFSLKQTRDYLLPKLISGEIQVKDAAKKVKEVL